ncbi:YfhO family protein [Zobellia galactanivorans]|uniref:YfhO family protein n=1 Tax=Zobellia galactanivorans (strain DSM 12802 / CCUG 47099 / CIP 106680 / NCIMB 13871 / Dsij) TaxID=63186 RepID=UPI0026E1EB30|nr:YfhO family protein [Zobellia galactanivorans]MDO6807772.1 YfhO family protein [Zobellia galactanivorans]
MQKGLKAFFVHFFVTVFFVVAALAYFYPVLQGKVIEQSDIVQFTGMAKEQNDFRKKTGDEPYWTNSAFGGMPTYQLGAYYPHDYIKTLDRAIRFLPRPADYLFLYFIGFYILLCCLKVDYRLAIVGALAFGFSTYFIIILGVGHNAKAHALGYLPMVLGGIVLVFRKKYLWGFILTAFAMALEIKANHYQMTYYFMLLVLILGAVYLYDAIRNGKLLHYFSSVGILLAAVLLGIAANATSLMATKEYADWSTRGKSELTINPDGTAKENTNGLDKSYITQWSYGITESLNLFVPRLFGGSNSENLGESSKTFNFLVDQGVSRSQALNFSKGLPLYWSDQPGTSGPAYIGAIIFFLFVLGLILVKGKTKWWLLGGVIMSLLLSWGKNFSLLTDFMIDYFPLYDKFRAVSSIQVILELCAPVLAILALRELFTPAVRVEEKLNALKISFFTVLGLCVALFIFKAGFDFVGPSDEFLKRNYGDELVSLIQADRKAVYNSDLLRSLIYVILAALALWFYIKGKLKENLAIVALGALIVFDLVGVGLRYVDGEDFVSKRRMTQPFPETAIDQEISKDKSIFRVYDPQEGINGARTSYYHQSIGGYHAAKPAGLEDLFSFYIYKGNLGVLNMLNVKYVVQQDEEGKSYPAVNPNANGNAWFVSKVLKVDSADEEILALNDLDTKTEAVVNQAKVKELDRLEFALDSTASIRLTDYRPNHLVYESANQNPGLAVFSEMYYPHGWHAYIDGKPQDFFRVNYTLRAMEVPQGSHKIEFIFEPEVVATGSKITLASNIFLALIVLGGIGFTFFVPKKEKELNDKKNSW